MLLGGDGRHPAASSPWGPGTLTARVLQPDQAVEEVIEVQLELLVCVPEDDQLQEVTAQLEAWGGDRMRRPGPCHSDERESVSQPAKRECPDPVGPCAGSGRRVRVCVYPGAQGSSQAGVLEQRPSFMNARSGFCCQRPAQGLAMGREASSGGT